MLDIELFIAEKPPIPPLILKGPVARAGFLVAERASFFNRDGIPAVKESFAGLSFKVSDDCYYNFG